MCAKDVALSDCNPLATFTSHVIEARSWPTAAAKVLHTQS